MVAYTTCHHKINFKKGCFNMSIPEKAVFEQLFDAVNKKAQKDNQVFNNQLWLYMDYDGEFLGAIVRTNKIPKGKDIRPWHLINGKWKCEAFWGDKKPIYGIEQLKLFPNKAVMFVEGEKTADAAQLLFPDMNVVCWQGGAKGANKADLTLFKKLNVYLVPDNDKPGYDGMEVIASRLLDQDNILYMVNVKRLGVGDGWDIADLDNDNGEVEPDQIREFVFTTKQYVKPFELIDKDEFPDLSAKGNPINTTDNIACLLDYYSTKVRYNEMTNYPEFYCSGKKFSSVNEADCHFVEISNLCVKAGVPKLDLANHLLLISDRNRYHPACDFILSKPWDGISRIDEFTTTIQAENPILTKKLLYRWMLGAVAAPFSEKGIALDGCLIIQGKQRIGKTHWFLNLVPEEYRYLVKSGMRLDPDNKDSIMDCTQSWLVELGEADGTIRKSHVSAQKQFITKSLDHYRVPFGKRIRAVPRRTAFYGSVNPKNYLADDTGNRRYWSITATSINHQHGINMQQVWAEFKVLLDSGESYRLTDDEHALLNESNKEFELIEPLEELLKSKFNWDSPPCQYKNCAEILVLMNYDRPNKNEANKIAAILNSMGVKKGSGNNKNRYHIPIDFVSLSINSWMHP